MPSKSHVQAVVRALRILEIAGSSHCGVTLSDVKGVLSTSKQTAHNLITTLIDMGCLVRLAKPIRYKLSDQMESLRQHHDKWNKQVLTRATPVAIRLARESNSMIVIGQFVAGEVLGRLQVSGGTEGTALTHHGWRVCPYGTAILLQAFMCEQDLVEYRSRHPLSADGALGFWRSYELLDSLLKLVREGKHLAYYRSGIFRAAAIFSREGVVKGMLSAAKRTDLMVAGEAGQILSRVRKAADCVSAAIEVDAPKVTVLRSKKAIGESGLAEIRRLKHLENENRRLKGLLAKLTLNK